MHKSAQNLLVEIKDDRKDEVYCQKERVGTAIIAHGNSAPVLKSAKHNVNFVLLIEILIIKKGLFGSFGRGDGVMPLLSNASRN